MKKTLIKSYKSIWFALDGLKTVWKEQHNFRIETVCAILVLFSVLYFDFSFEESVFCIIAITMVLSAEIINTAVEDICNKIEPRHHPLIGKIKDTTATFVLLTIIGGFFIGVIVFLHHFKI